MNRVQIKICGLTQPEEARACAEAGADAIGLVFYPPSPRFVTLEQATLIRKAIPQGVPAVGVFVDLPVEDMIYTARQVGLQTIQLHGNETSRTIWILKNEGFRVIKVLRTTGQRLLDEAAEYSEADGFLVEASRGSLPGGNGATWQWSEAKMLAPQRPFILAGGLNASNIAEAIQQSGASAVDVSSGVELTPGFKNISLIQSLVQTVHTIAPTNPIGVVFP